MAHRPYPEVPPQANFPEIEQRVAARWREQRVFEASVEQRPAGAKGDNEYVFYDGPPFANGLPHFGHLLTGYVKDVVPRYQTLRGRRVERRFGWDCHGLPAEMEAEKELGVAGRDAIQNFGIERFNEHCRRSVMRYTEVWQETITRAGRWVDFQNDYKTMDLPYMESVLWAFSELHKKGLIYEGYRVMPYSWACETPVSNFETRMDDSTRERQDPAITVRFELLPEAADDGAPTELLAWTTTPWTLPANLALAVGPDLDYALLEKDGRRCVIGAALLERYRAELGDFTRVGTLEGRALEGRRYRPLFPYFAAHKNAFRVLGAKFVDVAEGTGIVHMAPGFGEDDLEVCAAAGIEVVTPVDARGRFTDEISDYAGQHVHEANREIIRALKARGALVRHETITHNYPHCWRTGTPLIYRAMNSWHLRVTALKERLLALNQQVNWIPGHIRDGLFGRWLENARDWSISRNRFWGSPIPLWRSDNPAYPRVDVYGSIAELERDFGVPVTDLHRPAIDALTRPNPDDPTGESRMRRVPEVLDCWFESGAMPFAQAHYPFENRAWFQDHFPADFIVEYAAQTRGWFYTLFVLGAALFDRPPFRNCLCHGVLLAADGQKLSKRLRNYPEPTAMFERFGSDALRFYLMASPVLRGGELRIAQDGRAVAEVVRGVLNPIWNAWHFFSLYANSEGVRAKAPAREHANGARDATGAALLDRYLLSKTRALVEQSAARMDAYDIAGACAALLEYLDALNNWYIRRSRPRFWRERPAEDASGETQAAYDTLGEALRVLCIVASPLLPHISDEIHHGLSAGARSVHLESWPDCSALPLDRALVANMDTVRAVCSVAREMRERERVRVRQPLARLTVAGAGAEALRPYLDLLRDEVNVKTVALSDDIERFAEVRLQLNARALGPRLGADMKAVLAAARRGAWERAGDARVTVAGHTLEAGEFAFRFEAKPGVACQATKDGALVVVLDFALTEALLQEGLARDVVRAIQQARREAGLHVSDRIRLALALPEAHAQAVRAHAEFVKQNTLAVELAFDGAAAAAAGARVETELAGQAISLWLEKAAP